MKEVICSPELKHYFDTIQTQVDCCYRVAAETRAKGLDPELKVEIPQAYDLATRCEHLLKLEGLAAMVRHFSKGRNREEVSLLVAKDIARRMLPYGSKEKALDLSVRAGLAVLTDGILVAPLEGIASMKIGVNSDGTSYTGVQFAGPIRAAGGTPLALSVLIADVVRRELKIGRYKPLPEEIERYKEEIPLYKRVAHLQYTPSSKEIELIVSNCPVCIDGEPTEEVEVTGYRNLSRVGTNRVRGGACLVIAEGLCQKAQKIQRHVRNLGIDGWEFLDSFIAKKSSVQNDESPDMKFTYLKEIIAGRPVFSYPSRAGGFRLRYGRSRATGLAAVGLNPATMCVLDNFIAVGTQLKLERPLKAGVVTPCDSIEGPIVLLDNGDLVELNTAEEVHTLSNRIKTISDLGEILIAFGEFAENNHVLLPASYCIEWWVQELSQKLNPVPQELLNPSPKKAFEIAEEFNVPLHPRYNLFWHDISIMDIARLSDYLLQHGSWDDGKLCIPFEPQIKQLLIMLGALHIERNGNLIFERHAYPLVRCLGLDIANGKLCRRVAVEPKASEKPNELVSRLAGVKVQPRAPTRIGAKMGRPEKAGPRLMQPPPHVLFPVGDEGGPQRLLSLAVQAGCVETELGIRYCKTCNTRSVMPECPNCGSFTEHVESPISQKLSVAQLFARALERLNMHTNIPEVKGVQGLVSRTKTPEPLEKGILRAKYGIHVFKDGTSRFDMTDIPLTHFKPVEIGLSIENAHKLGYTADCDQKPLSSPDQLVELKPQDIILSEECGTYLVNVAQFIDELMVKFYKLPSFYNAKTPHDLIGHLIIGLAPHTSSGVVGRIIGFTPAKAHFAHPYFHAAKRRNADGDEDSVMLLLDGLINFSTAYLPEKRGGQMDAPLVLTTRIDPSEIDKEVQNLDTVSCYPLACYEATTKFAHPKDIESEIDRVGRRLGSIIQYEDLKFTHFTSNITGGPLISQYKQIKDMNMKVRAQLALQVQIRAIDVAHATGLLVLHHFLPDIQGNLRKFFTQEQRCNKCGAKYRRIPLKGICTNRRNGKECGNKLKLTVSKNFVYKYLKLAKEICKQYGVEQYIHQRLELVEEAVKSSFENSGLKQFELDDFS